MASEVEVPWQDKMTQGAVLPSVKYQIRFGPRYFPLVEAYSPAWREVTSYLATSLGFPVRWKQSPISCGSREGVSAEVGDPHEVTPIELVMLARMGATVMGKIGTKSGQLYKMGCQTINDRSQGRAAWPRC